MGRGLHLALLLTCLSLPPTLPAWPGEEQRVLATRGQRRQFTLFLLSHLNQFLNNVLVVSHPGILELIFVIKKDSVASATVIHDGLIRKDFFKFFFWFCLYFSELILTQKQCFIILYHYFRGCKYTLSISSQQIDEQIKKLFY